MLWRSSLRYLIRHPWLLGLSILGVALGVAVVVSIDLANTSARRAFALSAETVTGKATHQVVGAAEGLDEAVYGDLRRSGRIGEAAPVVEGFVGTPADDGRVFQVLGVDPLAEEPFRPYVGQEGNLDLAAFMTRPMTGVMAAQTARALGLAVGDTLRVAYGGQEQPLQIVGLLQPSDPRSARAMENLLVLDIATAQELLGQTGRLSRIDLRLQDDRAGRSRLAALRAQLPAGTEVVRSATRTSTIEQMTRAFELNLTALSLLALVVGMFLIYNTMTFSVVQRRPLLGRLRALGVTRGEVFTLILGEAFVVGLIGTSLGLLLGIVMGRGLVQLVTQTINDLYYVVTVQDFSMGALTLVKGVGLGVGATLVATLAPAREAALAPPTTVLQRSQEESRLRRILPGLALGGAGLGALGGGVLLLPVRSIVLSYGALFCVILAFALLTPYLVFVLARLLRPVMGRFFGVLGRMAAGGIVATLSRTAVAVAALMIAIASTVGVGVMVSSFRQTVETWLNYSLQADLYIQPPSLVFRRGDAVIDPEAARLIATTPGVAGAYSVRRVNVSTSAGRAELVALDPGPDTPRAFRFKAGRPEAVWPAFQDAEGLLISEPFSYRHNLTVGDSVAVQTDRGRRTFDVQGVFFDYASDLGVVMMSRSTYERYYDDRGRSGMALYAAPGQDLDALTETLRQRVGRRQELLIRSNRSLREFSLSIFDRTFTITTVLRLLAVVVAFIGVLSALMALQLERAREFAVLRANGMTPRQLWQFVTLQTGIMGLLSGLLAVPLGLVLAYVLIFVINKRSFGWTLQLDVPPEILLQAVLVAFVAALLAGLYPSWKMARANPALALREE